MGLEPSGSGFKLKGVQVRGRARGVQKNGAKDSVGSGGAQRLKFRD